MSLSRPKLANRRIQLEVDEATSGLRLDQAIARLCPELSRGEARRLIARGSVYLARKRVKVAGRIVHERQPIEVYPSALPKSPDAIATLEPTLIELAAEYLVVGKPSGMVTAPTPETDRYDLLSVLEREHGPLYLVHRLDAPTSGLVIFARTPDAAARLSAQLADRTLKRTYRAILGGHLGQPGTQQEISLPIGGKQASTSFEILERKETASLVLATLRTGRTHQIRIHASEAGAPVVGDSKYGRWLLRGLPKPPRLALHAEKLTFEAPGSGKNISHFCPFPENLQGYFDRLC
jgi:23S rRNA pseudouridine1911/1915/1917 synthase